MHGLSSTIAYIEPIDRFYVKEFFPIRKILDFSVFFLTVITRHRITRKIHGLYAIVRTIRWENLRTIEKGKARCTETEHLE